MFRSPHSRSPIREAHPIQDRGTHARHTRGLRYTKLEGEGSAEPDVSIELPILYLLELISQGHLARVQGNKRPRRLGKPHLCQRRRVQILQVPRGIRRPLILPAGPYQI